MLIKFFDIICLVICLFWGFNLDKRLVMFVFNIKGFGIICKIGKFLNFMIIRLILFVDYRL